jgi:hypothetical protein
MERIYLRRETVEENVKAEFIDAESVGVSFLLIFEAGDKRVGGFSLGKRLARKAGNPLGILSEEFEYVPMCPLGICM